MPWITVKALVERVDEDAMMYDFEQESHEMVWRNKAIRSESIYDFDEMEENRVAISFLDRTMVIIEDTYDSFFERIKDLDYGNQSVVIQQLKISNEESEKS